MSTITYVNPSDIVKITIRDKRQLDYYEWHEEIPSKPKKFLGVVYGETIGESKGWNRVRLSNEDLLKHNPHYIIDEEKKKVFRKPSVEIDIRDEESLTIYFDTVGEAEIYVNYLIQESEHKLLKIVHN